MSKQTATSNSNIYCYHFQCRDDLIPAQFAHFIMKSMNGKGDFVWYYQILFELLNEP